MIRYERTRWFGLGYLPHLKGSLAPRCLPMMIAAAVLAGVVASGAIDEWTGFDFLDIFGESYSMQLFGVVFGYFTVNRLGISYDRYREGVFSIKTMHSKWFDACAQERERRPILAFDQIENKGVDVGAVPFCVHMVKLFTQLSAMATLVLHVDDWNPNEDLEWLLDTSNMQAAIDKFGLAAGVVQVERTGPFAHLHRSIKRQLNRTSTPTAKNVHRTSDASKRTSEAYSRQSTPPQNRRTHEHAPGPAAPVQAVATPQAEPALPHAPRGRQQQPCQRAGESHDVSSPSPSPVGGRGSSGGSNATASLVHTAAKKTSLRRPSLITLAQMGLSRSKRSVHASSALPLANKAYDRRSAEDSHATQKVPLYTTEEIEFLKRFPCPVHATTQRILRSLATRQKGLGLVAPPPIISRVYQELSNGLLAYNQAAKIKEVPVPFAYVQTHAWLLLVFCLITPFAIACFTRDVVLSSLIASMVVGGFCAMWLVTNELEDPFGTDANDLPLVRYHSHFVSQLNQMLQTAWLPSDQWIDEPNGMNSSLLCSRNGATLGESLHFGNRARVSPPAEQVAFGGAVVAAPSPAATAHCTTLCCERLSCPELPQPNGKDR